VPLGCGKQGCRELGLGKVPPKLKRAVADLLGQLVKDAEVGGMSVELLSMCVHLLDDGCLRSL
jgi:hypothetical protein